MSKQLSKNCAPKARRTLGRREGRKDGRSQMARDAAVRLCLLGRSEKGHTGNLNNRAA